MINMDPITTIKTVFGFFADEAFSDGTELTKDIVNDILKTRKLMELLDQFDERFVAEHLAEISEKKINMQPVFDQRKDLIKFAEDSMTTAFVDINVNRKGQFLMRVSSRIENSNIINTYLSGFYDIVFMKETKCASDEDKALFNSLADQICNVIYRIDQDIKGLGKRVDVLENGQSEQVDFTSFYDSVLKEFTEENDDRSADLVGNLSAVESYIDAYIEVGNERRLALSYLNDWFREKKCGTILIYGEPGHGKTTLCNKAVFEYKNNRFLNDKAANILIVSLNTGRNRNILSEKGVNYKEILNWGPVGEHKFSFEDCRGSLLFMDGFDEFVDDAARAGEKEQDIVIFMKRLGDIAKAYDIHIVVLSRTIAVKRHLYRSALQDISFSLSPITMEYQVKWLEKHSVESEYIGRYKELQADDNMRDLLGIPLLFRMIVHTRFKRISSNVVEFYGALFDHLMEKRLIQDKALESVRKGLKNLAYDVYCNDTYMCEFKDNEWNDNWVLAFYVKTEEGKKIGFFHRSFYQYFMAIYIYEGLLQVTEENAEEYLGAFAEREFDSTIMEYLSLLNSSEKVEKVHDNLGVVINALVRTEAYLSFIPRYPFGNASKTKIERSANIIRNIFHITVSLSYVIKKPFSEGLDTLISTFVGNVDLDRTMILDDIDTSVNNYLKIYSEIDNRADLSRANLYSVGLVRADLSYADMNVANLRRADLKDAILLGASLALAEMAGADLSEADLSGADLSEADLSGADLSGAKLKVRCFWNTIISRYYIKYFSQHIRGYETIRWD